MRNLRKRFLALFLSLTLIMPSTAYVWADNSVDELQDNTQSSEDELTGIEEDSFDKDNMSETESYNSEEMTENESLQYDETSDTYEEESKVIENAPLETDDVGLEKQEQSDEVITEEDKDTPSIDENNSNPSEENTSEDASTEDAINEEDASETSPNNDEAINGIENEEEATDDEESVIEEVVETEMETQSREALDKGTYIYSVDIVQKEQNYLNMEVNIPGIDTIISQKKADKVELTATMYYNGAVRQQVTHTQELKSVSDGNFDFDVTYFGKWMVSAKFLKDDKVVENVAEQMVGVTAERYNFAPFIASMPVLLFSMKYNYDTTITEYNGKPVPTIVSLKRYQHYDWNALPDNMYRNPFLTEAQNLSGATFGTRYIIPMQAYIMELYSLNPDSYFMFFMNDWHLRVTWPQLVLETNLPEGQYGVRFITDGSASYTQVKEIYGGLNDEQAMAKHEALIESYLNFREKVRNGEKPGFTNAADGYTNLEYGNLRRYIYAIMEVEEDTQWWVIRKSADTFSIESDQMRNKLLGDSRITSNYLNNLLAAVQNAGNTEQFKALYKFDDSAFEATRARGKKIMEVLGTSKAVEGNFPVKDYVRFTQEYYGDEYEYYYKGHPGWISEKEPERVALMDSLNMQILESSIAAELFAFYNDDIHMSGYPSTTFQNVGSAEANGGLYNMSKSAAYADSSVGIYAADMDFFITDLQQKPASDEIMALLEQAPCDKNHSNFLVEFNKTQDDTDIAIWDSTDEVIIYFEKDGEGKYQFIKSSATVKVTFNPNGGKVDPTELTVNPEGKLDTLPVPTRTKNEFEGWFTQKTDGEQVSLDTVFTEDTTIYAHWKPVPSQYIYDTNITQKDENYLKLDVKLTNIDKIIEQKKADKVELTATMYYNGAVRQKVTHTQELKSASDGNFDFGVTYFGKWMVSAKFLRDGKVVENVAEQMVGVTAERYNIGAFTASMPVLIFSLKLNGNAGLDTYDGKPVPSIVSMTRHQHYDWNALPENVYRNPLLTEAENRSAITTTSGPRMKAYVQELYALNPDSYFVFYVNDWECRVIFPHLALETNLPQDKYGVRFITDGSATYKLVKEAYGGLDDAAALEKHENLKQSYINFREEVRNGNRPGYVSVGWGYHNLEYGSLRDYVYAMVEVEPDAEWWVIRRAADTFDIESTAMRDKMLGDSRISNNYLNNLLAAVQSAGNTEQFKALYKFDDSAFEATRAKGKKIMEVLGTSKAVEANFPVKDYIRFTQEYYGDEYEYYYKGHPGWISENEPERVALMDSINMQILESSIAAELFSFYNPDIHMSGYPSTTFLNVGSAEVNGGLYNMTKSAAYADSAVGGYAADMDFFITDLQQKPASDEIMALLEQAPCDKSHSNFLVEFNKSQEDTDIAIWDSTDEVIIYFTKDRNGKYVFDHMVSEAKVTFDANGGSVSPKSKETVKRMISSLPTPTRSGYAFNGWYTAKTGGTKITTSTTFSKDTTVYAQWKSIEYTVEYDANGGSVSPASVKTVSKKISKLATPTRSGYTFNGWYTAKTGGTKVTTSTTFSKDTTIYAQWKPIEYTVKYDANGGKVSPASVKTVNKKISKLATPTRSGYKFNGWFTAKSGGTKVTTSTTFNKDTTVYAQWTSIEYTVRYDANGGKVNPASVKTVNKKISKLATPTRSGYKFNGWFTKKSGGTKVTTSTTFNKDTSVYAQWTVITSMRRIYGGSRYTTSFAVAETYMKDTNQSKLSSIVVASGEKFPDALAGAYFGNSKKAPVILWKESENAAVQKFIKDNVKSGGTVYILGGENAVGESIKNSMSAYKFKRISGSTRYSTNIAILDASGIGNNELLVCDGTEAGIGINAIIAASAGKPIFLVDKRGLKDDQKMWLNKNKTKIKKITIIGDAKSVDGTVEKQLKTFGTVTRISGTNADELSAKVANTYHKDAKEIYIATMNSYPDGLCGGVIAIFAKAPILLVNESKYSACANYSKTLGELERATILGGPKAVSDAIARKVAGDSKSTIKLIQK